MSVHGFHFTASSKASAWRIFLLYSQSHLSNENSIPWSGNTSSFFFSVTEVIHPGVNSALGDLFCFIIKQKFLTDGNVATTIIPPKLAIQPLLINKSRHDGGESRKRDAYSTHVPLFLFLCIVPSWCGFLNAPLSIQREQRGSST